MKYAILMTSLAGEWEKLSPDEQNSIVEQHEVFTEKLTTAGKLVTSFRLAETARTVRRDAQGTLHEGEVPFSGPSESVGGIYVIEADSYDEAMEWARESRFMIGTNEVRPFHGE